LARIQQALADDPVRRREHDLFRTRLDDMIDMSHPLVRVGEAMPWRTLIDAVGESMPVVVPCRPA